MKIKIFISILMLLGINIYAQDTIKKDSSQILEEVIIESYRMFPLSSKTTTKEDIKNQNIGLEPSFVFSKYTPSITVNSDAGSYVGYSYFRIRGIDQTRINMTLDGMPLNESEDQGCYFGNQPDLISSVNSFQIQRGVGTSSNGTASYGGSMNFETPSLYGEKSLSLTTAYGSFNTSRISAEYSSGLKKNKSLYIRASNIYSDGYKYHSGNSSKSIFINTGIKNKKNLLKFTILLGNQKNDLAWIGVPLDTIKKDPRTNGDSKEKDNFLQAITKLSHVYTFNENSTLNTTIFYNFLKGNYDFDLNNFLSLPLTNEMYNYAFEHNFYGIFSNYKYIKNNFKFYTGVHFNFFNRQHIGSERTLGELYTNTGYKNDYSVFAKVSYKISILELFADVNYRYANFNYNGDVPFTMMEWKILSPRFGVNLNLNENSVIYYSIGRTEREPCRNDIFVGNDNLSTDINGVVIFNNIKPERVVNQEIGWKEKFKKGFLCINLYDMSFKNEILLNGKYGPTGLALHSNAAKSFRSGAELDFNYKLKNITLNNTSAYSYNRIIENNIESEPILTPNLIINQEILYNIKKISFGVNAHYQNSSYIDWENKNKLPEFFTIDLVIKYNSKYFDITACANNLTNQRYYTNGYMNIYGTPLYFIQAPLNYFISLTYKIF